MLIFFYFFFAKNTTKMIPKNIFQVWVGPDDAIPFYGATSQASIAKYMPSWTYKFWKTDELDQFVATEFPDMLDTYREYPHDIQRADAARPMLLKKYGGLYLDLHFELLAPLDELFVAGNEAYFLASQNTSVGLLSNSLMAAVANAPVLDAYLLEMQRPAPWWACWSKHLVVYSTTGPMALTKAVHKSGQVYGALPVRRITPCSTCDLECDATGLMRQMPGKLWHKWDSSLFLFVQCHPFWFMLIVVVSLFAIGYIIKACLRYSRSRSSAT
jgi:mannosyltransferase OCH1-like enzyme